jgi:hypothetical protein
MGHDWKIGDWAERDKKRWLVTRVRGGRIWAVGKNPDDDRLESSLLESFIHLPDCTGWDWQPYKPEPQYRPFANAAEFMPHRDRWISRSEMGVIKPGAWRPIGYSDVGIYPDVSVMEYADAFKWLTFEDGSPFGVCDGQ